MFLLFRSFRNGPTPDGSVPLLKMSGTLSYRQRFWFWSGAVSVFQCTFRRLGSCWAAMDWCLSWNWNTVGKPYYYDDFWRYRQHSLARLHQFHWLLKSWRLFCCWLHRWKPIHLVCQWTNLGKQISNHSTKLQFCLGQDTLWESSMWSSMIREPRLLSAVSTPSLGYGMWQQVTNLSHLGDLAIEI